MARYTYLTQEQCDAIERAETRLPWDRLSIRGVPEAELRRWLAAHPHHPGRRLVNVEISLRYGCVGTYP